LSGSQENRYLQHRIGRSRSRRHPLHCSAQKSGPALPVLQYSNLQPNQTSKMFDTSPTRVTQCQDGYNGDLEFVVACKGRPFTILTSSNLPTPSITLVDHKLVAELKIRMSDLQCSRFHYGGKKLRILGKISTSVQCITAGIVSGNMHLKASVVENLCDNFDVHSIAGQKMSKLLTRKQSQEFSETEPTTPIRQKKKKLKTGSPSQSSFTSQLSPNLQANHVTGRHISPHTGWTRSPSSAGSRSSQPPSLTSSSASRSSRRSPPGFPRATFSPSINIASFNAMGGSTDGSRPGPILYPGHGPNLCLPTCRPTGPCDAPMNCGYSPMWQLPPLFQLCGGGCRGGFCDCLRTYDGNGYYG